MYAEAYHFIITAVLLVLFLFVVVNLWVLPRIEAYQLSRGEVAPSVAVLIPARNEAANIGECLSSILAQTYPSFTVWVYDDASTDATGEIADQIAAMDARLQVVHGSVEPPAGWLGKAHACYRLYEHVRARSSPDYILSTDADVRFEAGALVHAVAAAQSRGVGLLSAFPRQVTVSWAERLAVPVLLHWAVYTFLPLPAAFSRATGPAFAAANGQFMLFTRQAYEACGGHEAVRSEILEDVALARAVKRAGHAAILADAGRLVTTRMYNGPGEVWRGYSKNAYAFFGYSPLFLALGILILTALYIAPPILMIYSALRIPNSALALCVAQYALGVLPRLLLAGRFGYRVHDALLHPASIAYLIAILLNSARWRHTGRGAWKGRASQPLL